MKKVIEIDFSALTDTELSGFISDAMDEFKRRLTRGRIVETKEPERIVKAPTKAEMEFLATCITKDYVHAEMKDRYKEIALKYADWFDYKRYPTDLRGSTLKRWKEYGV